MDTRTRTRARDSRGRPVAGLYVREGRYIAGFKLNGRWHMRTLSARTLTEARRERESLLTGIRECRIATPAAITFVDAFDEYQESRSLSARTRAHERHLLDRHLGAVRKRPVQDITATEIARLIHGMSDPRSASARARALPYSAWTCLAVYRILHGTFALAARRGTLTRSPMDGIATTELPKQRNARKVRVLDDRDAARLVAAGTSERVRAALGLAAYAGLRLGELRALTWGDVDLEAGTLTVRRSSLPDGTMKAPKTEAGLRTVPLLPALRRLLVAWKLRSPRTLAGDLVACTVEGSPMQERNLRRCLDDAKEGAGLDGTEERLSWHSLRHSFASMLATDLELAPTTLAELVGHSDPGFTLKAYARDGRDTASVVEDVLARAAAARVGA